MPRFVFRILALALLAASPRAWAQTFPAYCLYLGGYPQQETNWSNDAQGVAHDDNNWILTQTETIWKVPVGVDLRTLSASTPGVLSRPLSFYSALAGFHHIGDPVVYKFNGVDYLLLPIEGPGNPGTIAIFNCATMALLTTIPLLSQAGDAGWCAVDESGIIYSSLQHASSLTSYTFNWPLFQSTGGVQLTVRPAESMLNEQNGILDLVTMQGGEFGPGGLLYLISGFYDDNNGLEDREGLHILKKQTDAQGVVTWKRLYHSTRGFGHFDFYYDPGFPTYEEPEGLTIWDLDDGRAPGIRGQLHAFVSDNDAEAGDIDFKHYTSVIRVNPSAGCIPGNQPGTPACPFTTIPAALNLAWDGSEIRMRSAVYNGGLTISRGVLLTAENGPVRIGH